jgi:hypothetical protein
VNGEDPLGLSATGVSASKESALRHDVAVALSASERRLSDASALTKKAEAVAKTDASSLPSGTLDLKRVL